MLKIGGFIATMATAAGMMAFAAGGTGAYFTDSERGTISASSGHLNLNTTSTTLSFTDLVPGQDKTQDVRYNVDTSTNSDVWLVFDQDTRAFAKFSGAKNDALWPEGGLGRYGHFAVSNDGGVLFSSYNLAHDPAGNAECADANGHGIGSMATSVTDTPPYCGVPSAIKIASNLSNGQGGTVTVTFGVTGRWTAQNAPVVNVPFTLVATQAGHGPNDPNF